MQMTMVAKMKLIYLSIITIMGQTIMCISSPRIKWVGNRNQIRNRNVFLGMICFKGHNQMLFFQQQQ